MELKRLFDCLDYQLSKFPKADMLAAKVDGSWQRHSTREVQETVNALSAGLLQKGISGNDMSVENADKVAIISNNRPEWIFADLAVQQTGAILVPVYPTTSSLELEFIFRDAAIKMIFVSSKELLEKILIVADRVPSLKNIYTFDNVPGAENWRSLLVHEPALLQEAGELKARISPKQVATIIYTSGTTGTPKGVMLSHENIYTNVQFSRESFPFPDAPMQKVLSFLPLNHIFEKMVTYIFTFSGISIYYAESLETIAENLREIKPDGFTTVPRLLEKVFEKIMSKGNDLTGVKRKLFFWAVALAEKYDNHTDGGIWYNAQLALANKLIFSKWRDALGGNISFVVTGGAACQVKLLRIFTAAKIPIYEGYGPTENSPVISVNRKIPKTDTRFGTVGPPIKGIEVKLAEDGEILVKGPTVMLGYYKRPDLTEEVIIDGWLHTGDIGVWESNRYLKITDRKKELFKTSGGKYVAPQPIENKLKESTYVEQVMVVGSGYKFVGALIVPSFTMLREWMRDNEIPFTTNEAAIKHPKVIELFIDLVDSFNKYFNHVEQIKKFELLPNEWGIETGEMTPKMSLKRKVVLEKHQAAVDRIYS
ncbi:long-chain fatty acid--CoA ligase [Segetibacter sp.]|jgi:long-chain acyl-CoA synthetase|uniref:AMP-dependent synthetase/ligase n=1 Tax=Segetibacter sp. TaxID=2231182 RepID=UPI0026350D0D|nr:long-chain fatty acid--CoA ligase [Segetibacter sp.]MCW3082159.1 long-chain fatty acid--CoA ligase [Segetibacter sp.]